MKITIALLSFIVILCLIEISHLQKFKKHVCNAQYYSSNLSREDMKRILLPSVKDSIYLMLPGDTNVLPYLIKQ